MRQQFHYGRVGAPPELRGSEGELAKGKLGNIYPRTQRMKQQLASCNMNKQNLCHGYRPYASPETLPPAFRATRPATWQATLDRAFDSALDSDIVVSFGSDPTR